MSSSKKISDYPNLVNPARMRGVSETNAKILLEFIDMRLLDGIRPNTLNVDVQRLAKWIRLIGKDDVHEWEMKDIRRAYLTYLEKVSNEEVSGYTLDVDLRALKTFWRFIAPDKPPIDIKKPRTKIHLQSCDIVTTKQILAMKNAAEAAGDLRAAALIMTVHGTGCRISELLDANIGDVEIGQQNARIKVSGKTGFRVIPFVTGLPELQTWINHHPLKGDPNAPLFVTFNTRGFGNRRLHKKTVGSIFKKYAKAAGIPPGVRAYPHALRHRAASEDDRYMTHQEMCLKYGWSPTSDMPKRYTHTDLNELQNTVLQIAGVETQEEIEPTPTIIQCPRCKSINAAGSRFCNQCSLPLDKEFEKFLQKAKDSMGEMIDSWMPPA